MLPVCHHIPQEEKGKCGLGGARQRRPCSTKEVQHGCCKRSSVYRLFPSLSSPTLRGGKPYAKQEVGGGGISRPEDDRRHSYGGDAAAGSKVNTPDKPETSTLGWQSVDDIP